MDHIKIIKRAFNITVNYRILWIFGFLLALTGGSAGFNFGNGGSSGRDSSNYNGNLPNHPTWPFSWTPHLTPDITNTILGVAIGLLCFGLLLFIIAITLHLVSETALMRLVDKHETADEKLTFREGWHLGWSQAAWKILWMDLLVGFSYFVVFLTALLVSLAPLLVWFTQSMPLKVLATILSVGLILLLVFATILITLAINLVMLFARRAVALEDLGILESIRRGFDLVKSRPMDIILMGIMMFAIGLIWSLVMIPVLLASILAALVVAAVPALLIGGIFGLFTQGFTPWVVAGIVGVPLFWVTASIPVNLVGGWFQVFTSSTWTLAFRETVALEKTNGKPEAPAPEPAPAA